MQLEALPALLPELLLRQARERPQSPALTFLADTRGAPSLLDYAKLTRRATAIARELQQRGLRDEPVLLLFPAGPEYLCALLGCFLAGAIAVPAYPPSNRRLGRANTRVAHVVADTGARTALTTRALAAALAGLRELENLALLPIEPWLQREVSQPLAAVDPDQVCLLQYTSGSIAQPKGVAITHAQLAANLHLTSLVNAEVSAGPMVTWLPPYHDMGLIGTLLWPVSLGMHIVQLAPEAFVRRPGRWLQAISDYRATITAAPNFAFDLCVRRLEGSDRARLDLSSLQALFSGAEPVRAETIQRFVAAFESCGLRSRALAPSYGMAEAVLYITGNPAPVAPTLLECAAAALELGRVQPASPGERARTLVGCGKAAPTLTLRIVDPATRRELEAGRVGEIWVNGPSVASGYWRNPDATRETFRARLADAAHHTYLRTGDLGFLWHDELFILGRSKDVIIAHGIKHHAHDIEATAQQLSAALVRDAGAAFSIEVDGGERAVLVQELDQREQPATAMLLRDVASAVQAEHELALHAVVFVKRGSVQKTASGKVMRAAMRAAYVEGSLSVVAAWQAPERTPAGTRPLDESGPAKRTPESIERFLRAELAKRAQ
ncbi:MAG TPA: fatty acyl-AMP ligase, partial [Polyangiales bacterium]|nr:fatty acyl-AMP ligase [Polyangiales bacterium]